MTNVIHNSFIKGDNFKIGEFNHIHEDVIVGDDIHIRNYVELRPGTRIGNRVYLDSGVKSSGMNNIGSDVTIRFDAIIARNVVIEDNVFISPQVMFVNIPFTEKLKKPTIVRKGVKIGTCAVIHDGVELAEGVIIGAEANVIKSCLEPGVYVGNPAKLLTRKNKKIKIGENFRAEPGVVLGGQPTLITRGNKIIEPEAGITIGNNVLIGANTVVMLGRNNDTEIKDGVKIGALCNIGHDAIIGEGTLIVNGTFIAGHAEIGKNVNIMMGCRICNRVKIGDNTTIGMGSNVMEDIPPNVVAYGNPCKVIRKKPSTVERMVRKILP